MKALIIILSLSIFGIIKTLYLIWKRWHHKMPYCPDGFHCKVVLESKYNHLFGVQNDIVGFVGYLVIAATTLLLMLGFGPTALLRAILIGSAVFAAAVSLVLIYIQKYLLHAWCFICIISAINIGVMGLILFLDFL